MSSRVPALALICLAACSAAEPAARSDGAARSVEADSAAPADEGGVEEDATGRDASPTAPDASALRDAARPPAVEGGLGAPSFDERELDPASHGGTITFQRIGAVGWYPSRRDPAQGPCDAYEASDCCMAKREVTSDQLTPWDEDLILTLRGPLALKQLVVYQPADGSGWKQVSSWDARAPDAAHGITFRRSGAEARFTGSIGSECLIDVASERLFRCGAGSSPFCPTTMTPHYHGWTGSKLFVLLASMPHAGQEGAGTACSNGSTGNWYDAPWIGLSLGELVRAGAFSNCHCYAKSPAEWWLGDGCGQFNVFEVVNDNNQYKNLDVFSTNFFGYGGYVGEGPCGRDCDVSQLAGEVDLLDKGTHTEAARGAVASPAQGPRAAFRRPAQGYRYFVVLLDVPSREVQLALVHPRTIPGAIAELLPGLPGELTQGAVDAVRGLRLPR